MASGVLVSFLGAVQASLSVLLTIAVGVAGAQFGLVTTESAEQISHLCVRLLLPCLLIVNLGSELHLETAINFVPVIVWALIFSLTSLLLARISTAVFRLPKWAVPAIAFNNTESLPLLLLQSLGTTGVLASLTGAGGESDGINRARSYFLACSVVNNTITFGWGPKILNQSNQDSSIVKAFKWLTLQDSSREDEETAENPPSESDGHADSPDHQDDHGSQSSGEEEEEDGSDGPDEQTSLLPKRVQQWEYRAKKSVGSRLESWYHASPQPVQKTLAAFRPLFNPPFIGAAIGAIIGLTPALHRLFFDDMGEGGYFNAWLTACLKNVGELFVSLQVLVVGVKLSLSLRLLKKGEDAGKVPLKGVLVIIFIRFILWPAISIPIIWAIAAKTNVLPDDPILPWAMMMMPIGPTAMKVLALADVSGASEKVRMSIAKFLTLSYIITPLVSFAVVGALEAAKSAEQ
ncbi:auxin efflux carrier [Xylariomycetidae sp. FL2044]|nr:auxin efflux carrier [Xylariomycetidae sp. FL2044]